MTSQDRQDRIEHHVTVHAPVERVWTLVGEPGRWIGDEFPLRAVGIEPFRYAAYRRAVGHPDTVPADGASTLVECWLSELTGGATLVRILESGFAALAVPDGRRERAVADGAEGWRGRLDRLRERAERAGA